MGYVICSSIAAAAEQKKKWQQRQKKATRESAFHGEKDLTFSLSPYHNPSLQLHHCNVP